MTQSKQYRIWMLSLVPAGRFGRWWTALAILALGAVVYGIAAIIIARNPEFTGRFPWSIPLFFVCAVAYIVPMFHYITMRTHQLLDDLGPHIASGERLAALHEAIDRRPVGWAIRTALLAVVFWLVQSRLLAGSWGPKSNATVT